MTSAGPDSNEGFSRDQVREKATGRVLVVDDEKNIRSTLKMALTGEGFVVDLAGDGDEAEKILGTTPPDVILLDVRMPGRSGLDLIAQWKPQHPHVPIVLMSGEATLTEALEGLKRGAYDFLEKPLLLPRVINAMARAFERHTLTEKGHANDEPIIGNSAALKSLLTDVSKIAPLKTRVLITGESGTGKDLIARAIHQLSARSRQKFIKINCAAIPSELIESELFGHIKGAFTGAVSARRGLFEAANGGTLFLDEVGELSASAQAKILRALQNGEITPVGSDLTIKVDVRVISATNRELKTEIELGHFREDLFYRLAVVSLESPPLRARPGDIPLLTRHFAALISHENALTDKTFSPEVLDAMQAYPWPGNIRELRNAVERLVILGGPVINLADLPTEMRRYAPQGVSQAVPAKPGTSMDCGPAALNTPQAFAPMTWDTFKASSERLFLIQTLKHATGNISEAARLLGVERSTIHKWLKLHQIEKRHYLI